jgi:uncharacterized membrane protein YedE/YeeE
VSRRGQIVQDHTGTLRRGAIAELGGAVGLVSFLLTFVVTDDTSERWPFLGVVLFAAAVVLYGSFITVRLAERIEERETVPEPTPPEVLRWVVRFGLEQTLVTGLIAGYFFAVVGAVAGLAALVVSVSLWAGVWLLLYRRWSKPA